MEVRTGDVLRDTSKNDLFFVMSETFKHHKEQSLSFEILNGTTNKTYNVSGDWMRTQVELRRLVYQGMISPSPNFGYEISKKGTKIYIKQ
jgi:hypothetical protein